MKQKNLYQHFEDTERAFIDKIYGLMAQVNENYSLVLTEFLDPRHVEIVQMVCKEDGLQVFSSADNFSMEYARVIIAPDYYLLDVDDFDIALIELSYSEKFKQINHSQILGTLINRLGIKRSVIGDILVSPGKSQVMIDRHFTDYLLTNVEKVASVGVTLKQVSFQEKIVIQHDYDTIQLLSSSLRIDKVLSLLLKIPRIKVNKLIETGKVKLNYRVISKPTEPIIDNMLISISGFGRFTFIKDNGLTKNGKHKLTFTKFRHV